MRRNSAGGSGTGGVQICFGPRAENPVEECPGHSHAASLRICATDGSSGSIDRLGPFTRLAHRGRSPASWPLHSQPAALFARRRGNIFDHLATGANGPGSRTFADQQPEPRGSWILLWLCRSGAFSARVSQTDRHDAAQVPDQTARPKACRLEWGFATELVRGATFGMFEPQLLRVQHHTRVLPRRTAGIERIPEDWMTK